MFEILRFCVKLYAVPVLCIIVCAMLIRQCFQPFFIDPEKVIKNDYILDNPEKVNLAGKIFTGLVILATFIFIILPAASTGFKETMSMRLLKQLLITVQALQMQNVAERLSYSIRSSPMIRKPIRFVILQQKKVHSMMIRSLCLWHHMQKAIFIWSNICHAPKKAFMFIPLMKSNNINRTDFFRRNPHKYI